MEYSAGEYTIKQFKEDFSLKYPYIPITNNKFCFDETNIVGNDELWGINFWGHTLLIPHKFSLHIIENAVPVRHVIRKHHLLKLKSFGTTYYYGL